MQIDGIDGEAVEGIGWQGDDVTLPQTGDDIVDPVRFRFIGMDAQDLR
jgi:hypothetical protein